MLRLLILFFLSFSALAMDDIGPRTVAVTGINGPKTVVAQDGSGDYQSVQEALNALPDEVKGHTLLIKPGTYREVVRIGERHSGLTIVGASGDPKDVIITYNNPAQGRGTPGSATVAISADNITLRNLTFENSFLIAENPAVKETQAVAVFATGDRQVYDNCRFLSHQDTLFVDRASRHNVARQYFVHSEIAGDVDFIFGSATAVFDRSVIRALSRNKTINGYLTAASTYIGNPYGFLIIHSRLESDAAAASVYLGRPWHPSKNPNAIGQVVIRDSEIGAHIHADGWTDMSGFKASDARFFEYRNTGAGTQASDKRRQLSDEAAVQYTIANYLRGEDGWAPQ